MELYHLYLVIGLYEVVSFIFFRNRKTLSSKYGRYKDSLYIMELQMYDQIITGCVLLVISLISYYYPRIGLYLVFSPLIIYEFLAYIFRKRFVKENSTLK